MVTGQFEYVHNVRVPGMLHGQVDPSAFRRRDAGARGRRLRQGHARPREGRHEEELRRRRRRETLAGDSGREQIEGHVDTRARLCRNYTTFHDTLRNQKPTRDTFTVNYERRRRKDRRCGKGCEGDVPLPVSDARIVREFLRCGGRAGRARDDLVGNSGGVSSARQRRHGSGTASGKRAYHFPHGVRLLRLQRRGHRFLRCRAAFAGRRQTRSRAAFPKRRNGVGELRLCVCASISVSAWTPQATSSRGITSRGLR